MIKKDTMEWETKLIENDVDGANGIAFNSIIYLQKGSYKL